MEDLFNKEKKFYEEGGTLYEVINEVPEVINGKIVARDWTMIDKGNCIRCKKPIIHYTAKYLCHSETSIAPMTFLYDEEHGYCEDCAKKSRGYFGGPTTRAVLKQVTSYGSKVDYADGSSVEDEGWRTLVKDKDAINFE